MTAGNSTLLTRPVPATRAPAPRARTYGVLVTLVVAAVVVADQLAKAWAWRSLGDVHVNSGGNPFTGATIGTLLEGRRSGALFDIVNATLLLAAAGLLVRYSPSRLVAFAGAAALAGWVSNIGDRLGLHYVTAPGSVRGVVDFIPFAGHYWNLADVVIAAGSAAFVLALLAAAGGALVRRPRRARRRPVSALMPVLFAAAVAGVGVLAAFGATRTGYLDGPASFAAAR